MTACLGRRIAELADGRLVGAERDRALAHVAVCASCRDALDVQRDIRSRLASSASPAPTLDFLARLQHVPDRPSPVIELAPRRRRARIALAGGSAAIVTVAVVGGFASLGQTAATMPVVTPNLGSFAVEHAATADQVPLGGPALHGESAATPHFVQVLTPAHHPAGHLAGGAANSSVGW